MTLQEMIEKNLPNETIHKGFTTKQGKIIYWYTIPNKNGGFYHCFALDNTGLIISARYVKWNAEIKLINKT